MNWKAGDVAIIKTGISCAPGYEKYCGSECELMAYVGDQEPTEIIDGTTWSVQDAWHVLCGSDQIAVSADALLRKPYDGHKTCSWEDVVWCPAETVTNGQKQ